MGGKLGSNNGNGGNMQGNSQNIANNNGDY